MIYITPESTRNVLNHMDQVKRVSDERIPKVIETGVYNIRAHGQAVVRVKYGVLRSSIYADYKGKVGRALMPIDAAARTGPSFPPSDTGRMGLDGVVGTDMDYAASIEELDPYMAPAYEKYAPRVYEAIDKLIKNAIK